MTEALLSAIGLNIGALLLVQATRQTMADAKRSYRRHPLVRRARKVRKHTQTGKPPRQKARAA